MTKYLNYKWSIQSTDSVVTKSNNFRPMAPILPVTLEIQKVNFARIIDAHLMDCLYQPYTITLSY